MSAILVIALYQAQSLAPIRAWHPAGELIESVADAARGEGSLSRQQLARLSDWANRWPEVPEELREFYSTFAHEAAVGAVLWHALEGYDRPSAGQIGRLYGLFRSEYGYSPPYSLIARVAPPRK